MKTLSDVLLQADPLRAEARRAEAREASRAIVVAAPPQHVRFEARPASRRRMLAIAATLAVTCAAAAFVLWPSNAVDLVAAVRFEARIAGTTEPVARNGDIAHAEVVPSKDGTKFDIALTFTQAGAKKIREVTARNIGTRIELRIDGTLVMSPVIRAALPDASGVAVITGNYTRAEADRIVSGIIGR